MSRPSPDGRPTQVLPQTVGEPVVTTAPASRRARILSHVPARLGRARTSTVVIGCLFVLLLGVNSALPREATGTTTVTTSDGRTVEVPNSVLPSDARPTATPTATPSRSAAPASDPASTPAGRAPKSSTAAPSTTSGPTSREPASTSAPASTSRAPGPTSRAPSTSAEPSAASTAAPTAGAPTSAAPTS